MGSEYSMNIFICGDLNKNILKNVIFKLFKEKGDKSYTKFKPRNNPFDVYFCYNTPLENIKFYWIGHLFKQGIHPQLIENIGVGIQKMNEEYKTDKSNKIDIRRNNVILCFLKENEDSSIIEDPIKSMNTNFTLIEANNPIIVTVGGKNPDIEFEKLKKINRLPGGNNDDILRNLHSKLLTIDAYLNERGNIFDQIVYRNLGKINKVTATTCLDILIYGGSRSGKSTFINNISDSLLAREQVNAETCTTKCTEYIIPFEDNNNNLEQNNQGLNDGEQLENQVLARINQYTGKLKIIDTPGLLKEQDISKVCECINNYINAEVEIIQLALFFMKDTTTLNQSKEVLELLLKYNIPVFFIVTHSIEDKKVEETKIYKVIINFIFNNFREDANRFLIYKGEEEIYNIIRINQKTDEDHKTIFGVDVLIDKILHFFLYEKIDSLINNNLNSQQNFFQQRNCLLSCLSDLSINCLKFSLHNLLFRKFLTLADVSNYYYLKSISLVSAANFICCSSCLIPIPFVDLPIYYAAHYSMVMGILSVFGIKFEEVNFKIIMKTNGTNLGGEYNNQKTLRQIINAGAKIILGLGKLASDAAFFVPILGYVGKGADITFSAIDTSVLGNNLIKTCNKLPKNQQFFKIELQKFYYVLKNLDEAKIRITNEHHN